MWFVEVIVRCFSLTWKCVCHECVDVSLHVFPKDTRMCKCVFVYTFTWRYTCLRLRVHVCVCVCDDNPVITASVLASQRLTALFYSDLYNQCHISNTTNQTLWVFPTCNLSHTRTHTRTCARRHHAPSWPPYCVKQMLINMITNTYCTTYEAPKPLI